MPPNANRGPASWSPAPYGRACTGCSRAKCKCFYRADESRCERCQRLQLSCEAPSNSRKRKARTTSPLQPDNARLRLDQVVGLQPQTVETVEAQDYTQVPLDPPPTYSNLSSPAAASQPDVVVDTCASTVSLLRPATGADESWPYSSDMAAYKLSDRVAEEQLSTFCRSFLPIFPLIHLPPTLGAAELRQQKPFFWLVAMALGAKQTSQQFSAEEIIWKIISKRIVCDHAANIDLLLGLICFASWSHHFKKDKPFMTMLAQIAVSLAYELGLHQEPPATAPKRFRAGAEGAEQQAPPTQRTLEDRRTMLALFHLTSSTWTAYRKTEPLSWTPYMEECLRILSQGTEAQLDFVLVAQVQGQLIALQVDSPSSILPSLNDRSEPLSAILGAALLRRLNDVREGLPVNIQSEKIVQLYLTSSELIVKKSLVENSKSMGQGIPENFQRLQNLESALSAAEKYLALFMTLALSQLVGMNVELCTQMFQALVVVFKLVTHSEEGWDTSEIKKRVDIMGILDRACSVAEEVPLALGIVDSPGPRRGFIFKTVGLLKTIKSVFYSEMQAETSRGGMVQNGPAAGGDELLGQDVDFSSMFFDSLSDEPWLSDVFEAAWQVDLVNVEASQ